MLMGSQAIFVVGVEGRLVRRLGGPGEGSGECDHAGAVAVFADGCTAVVDVVRRGYHLFAADGEFERLVRMADPTGITGVGRVAALPGSDAVTRRCRPHSVRMGWLRSSRRASCMCRPWW